jgi:NagD protein
MTSVPDAPGLSRVRRPTRVYPGYVFDLDGTVYLGGNVLPGVFETLAYLRASGSGLAFLSNNPLELPGMYAERLRRLGIVAEDHEVVSSIDALVRYLGEYPPKGPILTVAEPLLENVLRDAGHRITGDPGEATMVVVAWDRTFDYAKLERAFRAARAGARIVASNPDPYCPTPDGGLPDCGAILASIEVASGVRAEAIVGKPSRHMAAVVLDRLGQSPKDVLVVGDRLLTDVGMAHEAGMAGALVLTGATSRADLESSSVRPDFVLEGLDQLIPAGRQEGTP